MMKKHGIEWIVIGLLGSSPAAQTGVQGSPTREELIPRCVPTVLDEATGNCLTASSVPQLGKLYPLGPELSIDPNGDVEIGSRLTVADVLIALRGIDTDDFHAFGDIQCDGSVSATDFLTVGTPQSPSADIHVSRSGSATMLLEADRFNSSEFAQPSIIFSQDGGAVVSRLGFISGSNEFSISSLHDADQRFYLPTGNADWEFHKLVGLAYDRRAYIDQSGNMAIDGIYASGGADVAEYYPVQGLVEPGDVVAFTGEKLALECAVAGTRTRLAGIVSSEPGLVLGLSYSNEDEPGENPEDLCAGDKLAAIRHEIQVNRRAPLALTGRVPCKVTAENGPVRPGDLLTISALPGHAMKATQAGAVIGTALEEWQAGTGTILVLANLGHFSPTVDLERRVSEQEDRIGELERRLEALARR